MLDRMYEYYMNKAIQLAGKAKGSTHPNPMVGSLIVKNNKLIASGYHKKAGGPHAEVIALGKAGNTAKGATLFVNLEPCSTFGKTPPCVDEIIKSGIKKVVVGIEDPNPIHEFKGINKLRKHHIEVILGVLREQARKLNEDFAKFITKNEPFITIKVAQSLDGKIASRTGDSKWVTSFTARRYAHKLRSLHDAVLVGANTAIKDNPQLNCRFYKSFIKQPRKIIVDSKLRISENARVFKGAKRDSVIVATTQYAPKSKINKLKKKNITVIITKSKDKLVDLRVLLRKLANRDIISILVEGGSGIITSFIEEKLVDKMIIFIAPKIIGGCDALTFYEGKGSRNIKDALLLKNTVYKNLGNDLAIEGYI